MTRRRFWAISPPRRVFWKASCRVVLASIDRRRCITTLTDRSDDEMSYFPIDACALPRLVVCLYSFYMYFLASYLTLIRTMSGCDDHCSRFTVAQPAIGAPYVLQNYALLVKTSSASKCGFGEPTIRINCFGFGIRAFWSFWRWFRMLWHSFSSDKRVGGHAPVDPFFFFLLRPNSAEQSPDRGACVRFIVFPSSTKNKNVRECVGLLGTLL